MFSRRHVARLVLMVVPLVTVIVIEPSAHATRRKQKVQAPRRIRPERIGRLRPVDVLRMTDAEKTANPGLVELAAHEFGTKAVALRADKLRFHNDTFRNQVKYARTGRTPQDQWYTGNCWIYAYETVLQTKLNQRGLKTPDRLSHKFINYHSTRLRYREALRWLMLEPKPGEALQRMKTLRGWGSIVDEGGWYQWANDIVKTYGILPSDQTWVDVGRQNTQEAFDAHDTSYLVAGLQRAVSHAAEAFSETTLRAKRQRARIFDKFVEHGDWWFSHSLGYPPEEFHEENPNLETKKLCRHTPLTYAKNRKTGLGMTKKDFDVVTLCSEPNYGDKAMYRRVVSRENGYMVMGMPEIEMYNVPQSVMWDAVVKTISHRQLREGVWFSASSGFDFKPYYIHETTTSNYGRAVRAAYWKDLFNYGVIDGLPPLSEKVEARYGHERPGDHAMVFTMHDPALPKRRPAKLRVENSHGEWEGEGGEFTLYKDVFGYVDSVTVPRRVFNYLDKKMLPRMEKKPLMVWDPVMFPNNPIKDTNYMRAHELPSWYLPKGAPPCVWEP